LVKRTSYGTPR